MFDIIYKEELNIHLTNAWSVSSTESENSGKHHTGLCPWTRWIRPRAAVGSATAGDAAWPAGSTVRIRLRPAASWSADALHAAIVLASNP